jgi:Fur family transcriptional regulator, ferric uptake regulator
VPRPSPVTDALRALVLADDRHAWSLDELQASVRTRIPSADFSTVLRAMSALERAGVVDRVDLGDGKARYEGRRQHHEHIRCTVCGSVAEVPGCVVEGAVADVERRTGYQVLSHRVVFGGVCRSCRVTARRGGRQAAPERRGSV